ncbi:MAG: hypothetical protein ABFS14_05585 [Gemmatimonadota bacterium]
MKLLLVVAVFLAISGCVEAEEAPELPAPELSADSASTPAVPGLRTEPLDSVRVLRLWLVNGRSTPVLVDAMAGADPVAVDSLGPLDSARVNLEVRADSVRISARSTAGREFGDRWLHVSEDSVTRVQLP